MRVVCSGAVFGNWSSPDPFSPRHRLPLLEVHRPGLSGDQAADVENVEEDDATLPMPRLPDREVFDDRYPATEDGSRPWAPLERQLLATACELFRDAHLPLVPAEEGTPGPGEGWIVPAALGPDLGLVVVGPIGPIHRFTRWLNAGGPLLRCTDASGTMAAAEDWLVSSRCARVLCLGLSTANPDEDATRPAVYSTGLLLEHAERCEERSVSPLAELVATHASFEAPSTNPTSRELESLFARSRTSPEQLDGRAVLVGAPREPGGPASVIPFAPLAAHHHPAFSWSPASVALAVLSLGRRQWDPPASEDTPEPDESSHPDYALSWTLGTSGTRLATCWRTASETGDRVLDAARHRRWISGVMQSRKVELVAEGRLLVARGTGDHAVHGEGTARSRLSPLASPDPPVDLPSVSRRRPPPPPAAPPPPPSQASEPEAGPPAPTSAALLERVIELASREAILDPRDIQPGFSLEADLGLSASRQRDLARRILSPGAFTTLKTDQDAVEARSRLLLPPCASVRELAKALHDVLSIPGGTPAAHRESPSSESTDRAVVPPAARMTRTDRTPASTSAPKPPPSARLDSSRKDRYTRKSRMQREALRRRLPVDCRLRRQQRYPQPPGMVGSLRHRRVRLLGEGPLAIALEQELATRGARLEESPAEVVIDAGASLEQSLSYATSVQSRPPRLWLSLVRVEDAPERFSESVAAGARGGLAALLGFLWPTCQVRTVELHAGLSRLEAAHCACDELMAANSGATVFRSRQIREEYALVPVPFPTERGRLASATTLLVTATAQPEAYYIVEHLVRRGCQRVAFIGPAGAENPDSRAVPPHWLHTSGSFEKWRLRLRADGADVQRWPCDLRDDRQVRSVLETVQERIGTPSGYVCLPPYPALSESDLTELSPSVLDHHRLFARGAARVLDQLDAGCWFFSLGRSPLYGSQGPHSFTATDRALGHLCGMRARSLHLAVPPWPSELEPSSAERSQGAASKDSGSRTSDEFPAEAGCTVAVDALAAGTTGSLLLAGRLEHSAGSTHPLLDHLAFSGERVLGTCNLRPQEHRWLREYRVDATPALPASLELEMLAAVAHRVIPGCACTGAEDVMFENPVEVDENRPLEITVRAEPLDSHRVRCTLSSRWRAADAPRLVTRHASAVIRMGEPTSLPPLPHALFPDEYIGRPTIYRRLQVGSAFQVLREASAVAVEGLLAEAQLEHAYLATGLVSSPLVLEAALQAAILHAAVLHGQLCLVASLDRYSLLSAPGDGDTISLMVQLRANGRYDVDAHGPEGPVSKVRGLRLAPLRHLHPDEVFEPTRGEWPHALIGASPLTSSSLARSRR